MLFLFQAGYLYELIEMGKGGEQVHGYLEDYK